MSDPEADASSNNAIAEAMQLDDVLDDLHNDELRIQQWSKHNQEVINANKRKFNFSSLCNQLASSRNYLFIQQRH